MLFDDIHEKAIDDFFNSFLVKKCEDKRKKHIANLQLPITINDDIDRDLGETYNLVSHDFYKIKLK